MFLSLGRPAGGGGRERRRANRVPGGKGRTPRPAGRTRTAPRRGAGAGRRRRASGFAFGAAFRETGSMRTDQILTGDCLRVLADLPEASVDLAFADPPFNIGYDYDVYDDRKAKADYLAWTEKWLRAVRRVLKPAGSFYVAIGDE